MLYITVLTHSIVFNILADDIRTAELFFLSIKAVLSSLKMVLGLEFNDMGFDFLDLEAVLLEDVDSRYREASGLKIRPFKCIELVNRLSPEENPKNLLYKKRMSSGVIGVRKPSKDIWSLDVFKARNRFERKHMQSPTLSISKKL